jgi:hypothetical protein
MAVFDVHLKAQDDSGHYRICRISKETAEEAQAVMERRELEYVAFRLTDEQLESLALAEAGKEIPDDAPPAPDVGMVAIHNQTQPYLVTSVEEVTR